MSPVTRSLSCLLAGWLLTTTVGCATLNLSKIDFRSRKASARNPVVNVVCLWEPGEGKDPMGVPCSGFAGRIMFMNRDSLSVSVDGIVRVYEFDNVGTVEEQSKPLHEFNFDSEAWSQHYMYGTVGPCYNVFIPYMRKGATGSTCSLRLRFIPKDGGPPVFSEMTPIEVHSHSTGAVQKSLRSSTSDSRVEQTTPEDLSSVNKRRRTTTIALDSKGGAASESTVTPETNSAPQVQQAGYRTDEEPQPKPQPLTAADAKIAQLEQMVRELQAMQGTVTPAKAAVTKQPVAAPPVPPRLLEEELVQPATTTPGRIRVRSIEQPASEQPPTRRTEPTDDVRAARTERAEPARHPLEDDSPVGAATTVKPTAKRARREIALEDAEPSKPVHRHPLDDDDDDIVPAKPAARRAIRAVEVAPQSDRGSTRSVNPFDPIETEQIETSSVDMSPMVRLRLRSVNQ